MIERGRRKERAGEREKREREKREKKKGEEKEREREREEKEGVKDLNMKRLLEYTV